MSAERLSLEEVLGDLHNQIVERCALIADDGGGCGEHSEFAAGMDAAAARIAERIRRLKKMAAQCHT